MKSIFVKCVLFRLNDICKGDKTTRNLKTNVLHFLLLQIYEALVEDKGKKFIFLRLSAKCVQDLGLKADTDWNAQVLFI